MGASVVGVELEYLTIVSERGMMSKVLAILENTSYLLHNVLDRHIRMLSHRLIQHRCSTERHRNLSTCVHQTL